MARLRRRYNHPFLKEKTQISDKRVLPGMVIRFFYNDPESYDRNPSLLVMFKDKKYLHGFNINYLPINQVKDVFRRMSTNMEFVRENVVQANQPYIRAEMNSRYTPGAVDGKFVYRQLAVNRKVKEAYRTYLYGKVSALEVISIDFPMIGFPIIDREEE